MVIVHVPCTHNVMYMYVCQRGAFYPLCVYRSLTCKLMALLFLYIIYTIQWLHTNSICINGTLTFVHYWSCVCASAHSHASRPAVHPLANGSFSLYGCGIQCNGKLIEAYVYSWPHPTHTLSFLFLIKHWKYLYLLKTLHEWRCNRMDRLLCTFPIFLEWTA